MRAGANRRTGRKGGLGIWLAMALVLIGLGAAAFLVLRGSGPSDQEQIYAILDDVRSGVARQDVATTTSHLTSGFHLGEMTLPQVRMNLMNFYREHGSSSVEFKDPQVTIQGDSATMTVGMHVEASPQSGGTAETVYSGTVTATLQKKLTHHYLIIPAHVWVIERVALPGLENVEGI